MHRGWTAVIVGAAAVALTTPLLIPMGIAAIGGSIVVAAACQAPVQLGQVSQPTSESSVTPTAASTPTATNSLPQATIEYLNKRDIAKLAEQNMERYLAAQKAEGIPWQVMAALHYREAGMNPGSSISNGAPLGSGVNVDGVNVVSDANQDAINMARHFKRMAEYVYDIDVTKTTMTTELWGEAFLAYNRGFLYKNKGRTYDQSPYVMNGFDEAHMNMRWIDADTVSGVDGNKAGALTVMVFLNGGSFSGSGIDCSGVSNVAVGGIVPPIKGGEMRVTSPFDPARLHPIYNVIRPHNGTDIIGGSTDIQTIAGGTVVYAGRSGSFGNYVKIDHGNGFFSSYAHLRDNSIAVAVNQRVDPGQFLGTMGATGAADGVHLHLQIWVNNGTGEPTLIDPEKFLAENGIVLPRNPGLPPSPYSAPVALEAG